MERRHERGCRRRSGERSCWSLTPGQRSCPSSISLAVELMRRGFAVRRPSRGRASSPSMGRDSCRQAAVGAGVRGHSGPGHTGSNQTEFSNPCNTTSCCTFYVFKQFSALKVFLFRCNFIFFVINLPLMRNLTQMLLCRCGSPVAAFMFFSVHFSSQKASLSLLKRTHIGKYHVQASRHRKPVGGGAD